MTKDWAAEPERGDDLEPERPVRHVRLSERAKLRSEIRAALADLLPATPDYRAEVRAALRELLAEPDVAVKLQGPPGPPGPQGIGVISGGGGGGLTIGGVPISSLAAGTNVTLTTAAGVGTVAASGSVKIATTTLTAAQVRNSVTSPPAIVTAQTNIVYLPIGVTAVLRAGATPFSGMVGNMQIMSTDGITSTVVWYHVDNSQLAAGTDQIFQFVPANSSNGAGDALAAVENVPLAFTFATGQPSAGNGTLELTIAYLEVTA